MLRGKPHEDRRSFFGLGGGLAYMDINFSNSSIKAGALCKNMKKKTVSKVAISPSRTQPAKQVLTMDNQNDSNAD